VSPTEPSGGAARAGSAQPVLMTALGLALAAAVSLGVARFAYALLLPPMRADLGWSYLVAGTMNTVNAGGYLAGALLMPALLRSLDARRLMLWGGLAAALLLALHGAVRGDAALMALRAASGVASAASFIAGGLLAARLASHAPMRAGQVLGIYYGGTGLGIVAAAAAVPPLVAQPAAGWPWAWLVLGLLSALATACTAWITASGRRDLQGPAAVRALPLAPAASAAISGPGEPTLAALLLGFRWGLAGYFMFGLGYIGYMTFIVSLLRQQGLGDATVTLFYAVLGCGVMASSFVWAGLLQRHRGGRPLATFNALLAVATVMPLLSPSLPLVFASGVLFGGVFLSAVAATTALVRHNVQPALWPTGIAAFTIMFAAGQIVGPGLAGAIADRAGGLHLALACSAAALLLGSLLAAMQRPWAQARTG